MPSEQKRYEELFYKLSIPQLVAIHPKRPIHIKNDDLLMSSALSGQRFFDHARAYRTKSSQESPCVYAATKGRQLRWVSGVLSEPLQWSDSPADSCHQNFSKNGGITLRLTDVHLMDEQMNTIREAYFAITKTVGETHAFYTAPHTGLGIPSHRDSGIQVIYQSAGKKKWILGDDESEIMTLTPGDFLILPLEYRHRTITEDNYSIHLLFMSNPIAELACLDMLTNIWKLGADVEELHT